MTKNVCFSMEGNVYCNVEGEFITETARDWFYKEGKSYQKCLDFLLSCMTVPGQPKEQLIQFSEEILLLKAKLVGNISYGTYGICYSHFPDNYNLTGYFPGVCNDEKLAQYLEKYLDHKKASDATDNIYDNIYFFVKEMHKKERTNGWLSPEGIFYPISISTEDYQLVYDTYHQWVAEKIKSTKNFYDEFKSIYAVEWNKYGDDWDKADDFNWRKKASDFLYEKQWASLSDITFLTEESVLSYNYEIGLTKPQMEYMLEYYSECGNFEEINQLQIVYRKYEMTKNVCFRKGNVCCNVEGEFITETARDWFYKEGKSYQECLDFLLSCMAGSDQPKEQLIQFSEEILLLKAKLVGNISYGICFTSFPDNYNLTGYFPGGIRNEKLAQYLEKYLDYKKASEDATDNIYFFVKEMHEKERTNGWLSPEGIFYPISIPADCQWANDRIKAYHQWIAEKIKNDFYDEFKSQYAVDWDEYENDWKKSDDFDWEKSSDFLHEKQWVWLFDIALSYSRKRGLTKPQTKYMLEYYSERGNFEEINRLHEGWL